MKTNRRLKGHLLLLSQAFISCSSADDPAMEAKWIALRKQMVATQLAAPDRNIRDPKVLEVMRQVPRHEFVPDAQRIHAYEDRPLPIAHGQTISQPYIVAAMTELLHLTPADRVLEIGTGSGYQAAVLGRLAKQVYTLEILEPLGREADRTLKRLGFDNVHVRIGDGYLGWPEAAPFDAIIVTCAPDEVPQPLLDQLKEGGRMIIPVGPAGGSQSLHLLSKEAGSVRQTRILPVRFVPMTGRAQE